MKQHHFEVYVVEEHGGIVPGPEINCEESATWWDGTVWNDDTMLWEQWNDGMTDDAANHLRQWLEFPQRVVQIYEEWTTDGWDINIMSDIMAELIKLGIVDARAEIAQ